MERSREKKSRLHLILKSAMQSYLLLLSPPVFKADP